jgi:radical S-adenosyl methionine domain-containing protein 2
VKKPGRSLLAVGVNEALKGAGFDNDAFVERGGIFEWTRDVEPKADTQTLEW